MSLSASYFEIERANAVTDPVTRIFANSGNIEYTGVRSHVQLRLPAPLDFNAAGQFLKAKQVTPDPTFNGFTPENTPKALGQRLDLVSPGERAGALGLGWSERRHPPLREQPGAGDHPRLPLFNAGVGYTTRIYGKRTAFQLNVDNLANLRYWNSVQTGPTASAWTAASS
jgi:iron complex outermembrane receptor protein